MEIDKGGSAPKLLLDLFAANHLTGPFQQNLEDPKGLTRETQPYPVLAKFPGGAIEFIRPEDDWRWLILVLSHTGYASQVQPAPRFFKRITNDNSMRPYANSPSFQ